MHYVALLAPAVQPAARADHVVVLLYGVDEHDPPGVGLDVALQHVEERGERVAARRVVEEDKQIFFRIRELERVGARRLELFAALSR